MIVFQNPDADQLGSKKSANWLSRTSRFSLWARSFSCSLSWRTRDLPSCLSITSVKEQTLTCPGKTKFQATCPKGKLEFKTISWTLTKKKNQRMFCTILLLYDPEQEPLPQKAKHLVLTFLLSRCTSNLVKQSALAITGTMFTFVCSIFMKVMSMGFNLSE